MQQLKLARLFYRSTNFQKQIFHIYNKIYSHKMNSKRYLERTLLKFFVINDYNICQFY